MPLVHRSGIAGRSQAQLKQLCADVTEAISKTQGQFRQNTCTLS